MKSLELYQKSISFKAAQGAEVTPEILGKINRYALKTLSADEVFVRKYLMSHNLIDRDNERFPEKILDDFAATLPGKSLLNGHDRHSLPIGLYFDANTEELTTEQFTALTGEEARLPEGIVKVKALWGWVYMLKAQFNESMTANIDAGIYRHASIGFKAADIIPVKGQYDNILYWEYVPPGEALEGSIVWLGAQPGATAQKSVTKRDASQNIVQDYAKLLDPKFKSERQLYFLSGERDWSVENPLTPFTPGPAKGEKVQKSLLAP